MEEKKLVAMGWDEVAAEVEGVKMRVEKGHQKEGEKEKRTTGGLCSKARRVGRGVDRMEAQLDGAWSRCRCVDLLRRWRTVDGGGVGTMR